MPVKKEMLYEKQAIQAEFSRSPSYSFLVPETIILRRLS